MHGSYVSDPRTALLEAAVHIGGYEGIEAITLERCANDAQMTYETACDEFETTDQLRESLSPYLLERKLKYLCAGAEPLSADIDETEVVIAMAEGYFSYFQQEPKLCSFLFEHRGFISQDTLDAAYAGKKEIGDEEIALLVETMRAFATSEDPEATERISPKDLVNLAIAGWAIVHGMCFLSVCGVLRFQHQIARRYNFREVLLGLVATLRHKFRQAAAPQASPLFAQLRSVAQHIHVLCPPDQCGGELNDMPVDEARMCILIHAIEHAGQWGFEAATVPTMARELGVSEEFVHGFFENDFALRTQAEEISDKELNFVLQQIMGALPADATPNDLQHAMAVGFFQYVLDYPCRFKGVLALANGSVVPTGGRGQTHGNMSASFTSLMELTRKCIEAKGVEPSDQLVYIKTLSLWAGATGIGHLCSVGDFRHLDEDSKWALCAEVVEVVLDSFEYSLVYGES